VFIPFNALTVGKIKKTYVAAIYGLPEDADIKDQLELLTGYKSALRSWSGRKIKSKMIEIAIAQVNDKGDPIITVPEDDDGNIRRAIKTFQEFGNWWSSLEDPNEADQQAFFEVCYGWWNKNRGWELRWETEWMTSPVLNNRWEYAQDSMAKAVENSKSKSGVLKGCVAKNISQKKVEIIKGMKRSSAEQTVVIRKRRSTEDKVDEKGKYKKLQPDEFVITKTVKEEPAPMQKKEKSVGKSITREDFNNMTDEEKFALLQNPTRYVTTTGSKKNDDAPTSLNKDTDKSSKRKRNSEKNLTNKRTHSITLSDAMTPDNTKESFSLPIQPSTMEKKRAANVERNNLMLQKIDSQFQDKYDTIEEIMAHKASKPSRGKDSEWLLHVKYLGWTKSDTDWEPLQKKIKETQSEAIIKNYMEKHPELLNPPKREFQKKKVTT